MNSLKVFEVLARAFVAEGTNTVFGLMGDANMVWMTEMASIDGVRLIHARHETAAVAMADGYSQAGGGVGVCSVTCGPGITQLPTSLTSAVRHRSPIVVLAGDTPRGQAFHLQHFEPGPLIAATGARHVALRTADSAPDDVQRAFYTARTERIPVVLTAPYDVQEEDYAWDWSYTPSTELLVRTVASEPAPAALSSVLDLLRSAKRPVILAGRGAVDAGARDNILQLAERCGAVLATTLRAKGWFDDEPFDIGLAGGFANPTARELLMESDVVLAFGASLGHFTTEGGYLFQSSHVIQVDVAPQGMKEAQRTADHHVLGDADRVATRLLAGLGDYSQVGWRTEEVRSRLSRTGLREPLFALAPGTVDPREAFTQINNAIPPDWLIVIGAGHFWNFAVQYMTGRRPNSYIFTAIDFGVVGQGLGVAIGAAVARPDLRVALIEGDGSLLMNLQELETIARHDVPLLTIVINDGAYGAEIHKLEAKGFDADEGFFGAPDLSSTARSLGVPAYRVDASEDDTHRAVTSGMRTGGPFLVDIHVSPTVRSAQYRRVFFGE